MADIQSLAMVTTLVTVGSTEAARLKKGHAPTMQPVIAGFILGVFLFGFGMASPRITALFCYLIMIGAVLVNGAALFAIAK